jgi:hypothetical protein
MKTFTLKTFAAASGLVALASLSVLPAYAETPKDETLFLSATNFESTKSRDQVREEYFQAKKDGSLDVVNDLDAPAPLNTAVSNISRQDVYAEMIEWRRTQQADIGMGD